MLGTSEILVGIFSETRLSFSDSSGEGSTLEEDMMPIGV